MSKLRHVLKLYCQGHSKLHISTTTGLSRNTVKKYLRIFISLKTTWEDIVKLTDKDLDELFNQEPPFTFDERIAVLHEFLKLEEKRLRQRGFTLLRLWENYHSRHPEGFKITAFYKHFNLWKRRVHPSMHMEHKAGDKMFVDFTGEKLHVVDADTGEVKAVEVFVAILGASQLTYVEAVESQRVEDFMPIASARITTAGKPQAQASVQEISDDEEGFLVMEPINRKYPPHHRNHSAKVSPTGRGTVIGDGDTIG